MSEKLYFYSVKYVNGDNDIEIVGLVKASSHFQAKKIAEKEKPQGYRVYLVTFVEENEIDKNGITFIG